MTQPTAPAPPLGQNTPILPAGPTARASSVGPFLGDEVRAVLRTRLRVLAPLLLGALAVFYFRNVDAADPATSQFGQILQLVLLGLIALGAAVLYGGPRLRLRGLRAIELLLLGLTATYLAWLQCGAIFEAWALREAAPQYETTALRLALGATTARWLLIIVAYGIVVPNNARRCAIVLGTLVLMPLVVTTVGGLAQPAFAAASAKGVLQMMAALFAGGGLALFACVRLNGLPAPALESEMIGQYQLKRPLRSGGMGQVYLAEHVLLQRPCALKLIRPGQASDPDVSRRFEREARTMAALRHPNAVAVHDSGRTADGTLYYVMEYVPGPSLEELVARGGPLAPGQVVAVLLQLCGAVREAHARGILHMDIKAGNVLVDADAAAGTMVKLLDFGLAREVEPNGWGMLSSSAEGAGTPQYMAPEQAIGKGPVDGRADIYGLGGIAYFLLAGRPPFECESALQLVIAHACDPVTPLRELRPEVPADLEAVVLRCLEKDPARRFADAAELARALGAVARPQAARSLQLTPSRPVA
jgi:serine/threonine-protein kinase